MQNFLFRAARKTRKILGNDRPTILSSLPQNTTQAASDLIKTLLTQSEPCMVSRFGSIELSAVISYLNQVENPQLLIRFKKYVTGEIDFFCWLDEVLFGLSNNAGFFPAEEAWATRFAELIVRDMQQIDILGSWIQDEQRILPRLRHAEFVCLLDLEPYYHKTPWSEVLTGKRVLVVHPFSEDIERQYAKRQLLFQDAHVLPEFDLLTLKSVQSMAGNKSGFETWFEALDWMCSKIDALDFDIAIIGAGAYGMPLAAHVKRIGKKAVHLGGATQLLFGIRGKRWDERPFYQQLYNDHWIRPSLEAIPRDAQKVEDGCYW